MRSRSTRLKRGGALDSITGVAQRYADEDRLRTVSDWNAQQNAGGTKTPASRQAQIPAGAQIGRDGRGNIVGYKLPSGQYVPLSGAQ
jgi:hypothetical protein